MTPPDATTGTRVADATVWRMLASPEAGRVLRGRTVARFRRSPGAYHSSFAIEDVEVAFEDGTSKWLVLKDLSPSALLAEAARAKPPFLYDPQREIDTYRHVLEPHQVGAPALVAAAADDPRREYLLLLERVGGVPLWQVGEPEAWAQAARWLAATHQRLAPAAEALAGPARLLRCDADYFARWRQRVERKAPDLAAAYDAVVPRLLALPRTVIHGEFHASNVIVEGAPTSFRIRPVDWEMAALAPGLMDLADLTAGKWSDAQRDAMASEYRAALADAPNAEDFTRDLDCCRLHRVLQWATWSDDWTPPREHEQDWPAEARRVAARLGVG
jgi:hypothetical protein